MSTPFASYCAKISKPAWFPAASLRTQIDSEWASVSPLNLCKPLCHNWSVDSKVTAHPCKSAPSEAGSAFVHAPFACATACNKQRYKAINHGKFSAILQRQKSPWLVHHEIRHRHFAAGQESGEGRKQSNQNEYSAH